MSQKINRYKIKTKIGYLGDLTTEWWTQEDYDRWDNTVAELKANGTYGQPITYTVDLVHNPLYDDRSYSGISSARLEFLDFSQV